MSAMGFDIYTSGTATAPPVALALRCQL